MHTKFFRTLAVSLLALSLSTSVAYAWTAPTATPPAGNIDEPINTSDKLQIKAGEFRSGWATIWDLLVTGPAQFGTATTPASVTVFGNMGITDTTTTANLKLTTGAGVNKWLTSDATGKASWATLPVSATYTAGTGLSLAGNAFSLNTANPNTWTGAQTFSNGLIATTFQIPSTTSNGMYLKSDASGNASWATIPGATAEVDGIVGNEVTAATNTTLTRSGSGTATVPYTLGLNLGNANIWTGAQTFGANTNFPGSGIWNTSGNVGIGTDPGIYKLNVAGNTNITGNLNVTGDITTTLGKGTFWDLVAGTVTTSEPTVDNHAATKGYTDGRFTDLLSTLPPTVTIGASPALIVQGNSTELKVTISGKYLNCNYSWTSSKSTTSGTYTVFPTTNTTYTATCTNISGTATDSVLVTVKPNTGSTSWPNSDYETGTSACVTAGYSTCTTSYDSQGQSQVCGVTSLGGSASCN